MIVLIEESQGIFNTITGPPNCLILSPMNHESQITANWFKEKPENQKQAKHYQVLFREIMKNASVVVTKLDDQHMALTIWWTNDLVIGTYYLSLNVHFTKQTKASEETRFGNITNESAIVRCFKHQWPTVFWKTRRTKRKIFILLVDYKANIKLAQN
jgi:hypothetical protein